MKNCFHRKLECRGLVRDTRSIILRIFIYILRVYIYIYLECGANSTKRSHYGMISSVLYRLFIPFVILFDYFIHGIESESSNVEPL